MKTGIHENIPIHTYHEEPGLSSTPLRDLLKHSPFYFHWKYVRVTRQSPDYTKWSTLAQKRDMLIGGCVAAHCDHGKDLDRYVIMDELDSKLNKNSSAFKDAYAKMVNKYPGKSILLWDEHIRAENIADALFNHPEPQTREELNALLLDDELKTELSYVTWNTELSYCTEVGRQVKARPDFALNDVLGDVKVTYDCGPKAFSSRIADNLLHVQAGMQAELHEKLTGKRVQRYMYIVVEKNPPHDVAVYTLDSLALALGRRMYHHALETVERCFESDIWPGKSSGLTCIELPYWYTRETM